MRSALMNFPIAMIDPIPQSLLDWTEAPPELLRYIFAAVLAPPPTTAFLPLLSAARQWLSLRLTCRAWAAALEGVPLAVDCCVPVPWVLPWLHENASSLRLAPPPLALSVPASTAQQALDWVQDRCGSLCLEGADWAGELEAPQVAARIAYEEYVAKLSTGLTEHNREPCSSFRFQSSLFVLAGTPWLYDGSYAPQPMLQLPRLQKLQLLDLTCGYAGGGFFGVHTFDAAPLARLPRLHTLILRGFEEPCLWGLPRTLRVLSCLGGQHNSATHNPVRWPRHHWALPAYCRLQEVELLGYNRDYREPGSPTEPALSAATVVQLFHSKRRFKVLLTNLWCGAAQVRTDADVLHLGPPDPELTTKRWLPPDHGLEVHAAGEEELAGALAALDAARGSGPCPRRLQLSASAWFALPSGALVPVAALAGARGRQLLQERWPAAAVHSEVDEAGGRWVTVEFHTTSGACPQ
ncbi:hypothetical protein ABPG77_001901 [Micractinium sp. CCAP 211/92]